MSRFISSIREDRHTQNVDRLGLLFLYRRVHGGFGVRVWFTAAGCIVVVEAVFSR